MLKQVRGRPSLVQGEKLDILFVHFFIYRKYLQSDTPPPTPVNATQQTANLLHRSKGTVSKLVKASTDQTSNEIGDVKTLSLSIGSTPRSGNTVTHAIRIPDLQCIHIIVRDFVRSKRSKFEHVTGVDILNLLETKHFINIDRNDNNLIPKKSFNTALRAVERWLSRHGFKRGARSGKIPIEPRIIAWRNSYLRELTKNRNANSDEKYQCVYLDESYLHQHYCRNKDSLYDPNDEQDVLLKNPTQRQKNLFYCCNQI